MPTPARDQKPYPISALPKSIGEVLSSPKSMCVPLYQRDFSWSENEIDELWEDALSIVSEQVENYFLGSMVFIEVDDQRLEVIDGQQRLASLSLLFAVIRDAYKQIGDQDGSNIVEQKFLCSRDLETRQPTSKLTLNASDNQLYLKMIAGSLNASQIWDERNKRGSAQSCRLLAGAYLRLREHVQLASDDFKSVEVLIRLVKLLSQKIHVIQIVTQDDDAAWVLFETLNDRGIALTLSDLLKNYIFARSSNRLAEAQHQWAEITGLIGQQQMPQFLRHEWMSRYGLVRKGDLYKRIKSGVKSLPQTMSYIKDLAGASEVYAAIQNPSHPTWVGFDDLTKALLRDIDLLGVIQCYPLLVSGKLRRSKAEFGKLLGWIVALTVRYSIIGGKGTGNLESVYAKAGPMARDSKKTLDDIRKELLVIYPGDDEFRAAFSTKKLTTPRLVRYVLGTVEMGVSGQKELVPNLTNLTIEHILPKQPDDGWPEVLREEPKHRDLLWRIGNLTLLTEPMNSECDNAVMSKKAPVYGKSKLAITSELSSRSEWNEDAIDERQRGFADVAIKLWRID